MRYHGVTLSVCSRTKSIAHTNYDISRRTVQNKKNTPININKQPITIAPNARPLSPFLCDRHLLTVTINNPMTLRIKIIRTGIIENSKKNKKNLT
jgi:hypothetical protein